MKFCLGVLALLGGVVAAQSQPATPIEHVIFLMQENHSFDNYFGTFPGADGFPAGVCMPVDPFDTSNTACVEPFHLGDTDVEMDDPDHSDATASIQFNEGKMNGFVHALNIRNQDGRLAMGYYDERDLPFYWNLAHEYVLFDRFFSSAAGGSFVNHFYWVTAAPDTPAEGQNLQAYLAGVPTIFDRLEEKGVSWKVYIQNYDPALTYRTVHLYPVNRASQITWMPLLTFDRFLDNPALNSRLVDLTEYYEDLANGTLPAVAFMVPSGPSEHPPSSVRSGQRFVKGVLQALMRSRYWSSAAFFLSYDDWGGWYDHVPPPQVDEHGYGFRVPALLVSAYARQGYIDSTILDYTSVLKFIEDNWRIAPLSTRDAAATSIVGAFDFESPPRRAEFLPYELRTGATKPEPKRFIIYLVYSAGLIVALAIFLMAWRRPDPRSRLPEHEERFP